MKNHVLRASPAGIILALSLSTLCGAQAIQTVPSQECTFSFDSSKCFEVQPGKVYSVGKDVIWLDDVYRFCLKAVTEIVGGKKIRVILALDKSNSMCSEPPTCEGSMKNDTANKRIDAAHLFVENLRLVSPSSEIGIVNYASTADINQITGPYSMDIIDSVRAIHDMIDSAACPPYTWTWSLDKKLSPQKKLDTYTGSALQEAFELVDVNYDSIKDSLERHIIILTDGDWFGPSPDSLIAGYQTAHPNRPLPTIHGVFLSDSARHVQFGHPSTGLFRGTCDPKDSVDLRLLESVTGATNGTYFPGTRPQTIIEELADLLAYIIKTKRQTLTSAVFTNSATGDQATGTITRLLSNLQNQYLVTIPRLELVYDTNLVTIRKTIDDPDSSAPVIDIDTILIVRNRNGATTPSYSDFSTNCETDSAALSIERSPRDTVVDSYITVTASVPPEDATRFAPHDIRLRGFTPFPDDDPGTLSLYHFDRNLKDSKATRHGSGSPVLSTKGAAFGYSVTSGSLTLPVPTLDKDFTIELWVRPGFNAEGYTLLSGIGTTFKVTSGQKLSFQSHTGSAISDVALDTAAWSHVAVSRKAGTLTLYVNGLPVSSPSASSGSITAGSYQVGPVGSGRLDELRISGTSRTESVQGITLLQIPSADNMQWEIDGNHLTTSQPTLPFGLWQQSPRGRVDFTVTSSAPRYVIINFFHHSPSELMWSKNSDRLLYYEQGLVVSPDGILVNHEGIPVTPAGLPLGGVPVTAILRDTDGNGYIDQIDLRYPATISLRSSLPSAQALLDTLWIEIGTQTIPLTPAQLRVLDDSTVAIEVSENSGMLETGWDTAGVVLSETPMTESGTYFEVVRVVDGAGPMVSLVTYHPDSTTNAHDTLRVRFSEPVVCAELTATPPSDVFDYSDDGTAMEGALDGARFLGSCSQETIDEITIILDNNSIQTEVYKDSLGFATGSEFAVDQQGNTASGRKSPIEWAITEKVSATIFPNPFTPWDSRIPSHVQRFYANVIKNRTQGTVISIRSAVKLSVRGDGSYGRAAVYDVIGNPVKTDLAIHETGAYGVYGIYWDGRNSNERYVGPGTYLAIISVTEEGNDKPTVLRKKIGVRH